MIKIYTLFITSSKTVVGVYKSLDTAIEYGFEFIGFDDWCVFENFLDEKPLVYNKPVFSNC